MKKVLLVGFGAVCENGHLPALFNLRDKLSVVGVFDLNSERLKIASEKYNLSVFEKLSDAFNTNPDIVVITTPPSSHKDLILEAVDRNCHVLCEKPLCINTLEFEEISELLNYRDSVVYTVHNWIYSPHIIKLKEAARNIGVFKKGFWCTLRKAPSLTASNQWRIDPSVSGGGILFDHGWHVIYILSYITGFEVRDVISYFEFDDLKVDMLCDIKLVYDLNLWINMHLSWKSPVRKNMFILYGDRGLLSFDDDYLKIEYNDGTFEEIKFDSKISASSAHPAWTEKIYIDFLESLEKKEKFIENFKQTKQCIYTIENSYNKFINK